MDGENTTLHLLLQKYLYVLLRMVVDQCPNLVCFFFQHLIPLPAFALLYRNIWEHWLIALNSPQMVVPGLGISMPSSILWLLGNVVSQYPFYSPQFFSSIVGPILTGTHQVESSLNRKKEIQSFIPS